MFALWELVSRAPESALKRQYADGVCQAGWIEMLVALF